SRASAAGSTKNSFCIASSLSLPTEFFVWKKQTAGAQKAARVNAEKNAGPRHDHAGAQRQQVRRARFGREQQGAEQQPRRRQGGAGQRQGLQAAGHFGTGGVQVGSGTFVQLQRSLPQPAVRVAAQPDRKQQQGRRDPYQHEQQLGRVGEREGKGQTARHAPGGQGDFPQFPLLVQKKPLRRFPADRAGGNFGNGGPGGLRRSGRRGSGAVGRILVEQIVHRHMEKTTHADDFLCFGVAAVTLPFADGLPGYIQSGGQFFLGHTRFLAQLLEFFAKRH